MYIYITSYIHSHIYSVSVILMHVFIYIGAGVIYVFLDYCMFHIRTCRCWTDQFEPIVTLFPVPFRMLWIPVSTNCHCISGYVWLLWIPACFITNLRQFRNNGSGFTFKYQATAPGYLIKTQTTSILCHKYFPNLVIIGPSFVRFVCSNSRLLILYTPKVRWWTELMSNCCHYTKPRTHWTYEPENGHHRICHIFITSLLQVWINTQTFATVIPVVTGSRSNYNNVGYIH